ncbi:hypothetical protein Stsp02_72100 [Streptomyces sp. NBRC 14336]|uniref:hypothetical protein n=1 Tax=Streptomyces sp. NBRC 14336 TaxID=3030992 RepID=UPI0024A02702|nr:hypothetical protein [Streptomyces sp. NBRC 14336]WBO78999.1 GtrA family protein [Streptomyces sp. SBE_14.2]GLW51549.1 hypothetical protein Stsp02_72100 [Streptomyces sp. NBRC 14336]
MTSPLASFARFVVCGGGVGLASGATVPLLATTMPWALANALITVASTLLCTELHALFTFTTGNRPGLRRHLQSGGSAAVAYGVTSAAILLLHTLHPSPSLLWEQTVYLTASGAAGVGRFLVLRLCVFGTAGGDQRPARRAFLSADSRSSTPATTLKPSPMLVKSMTVSNEASAMRGRLLASTMA